MTQPIDRTSSSDQRRRQTGPIICAIGPAGGESALRMARTLADLGSRPTLVVSVVSPVPVTSMEPFQPDLSAWPIEEQRAERLQSVRNRLHELGPCFPWLEAPEVQIAYGDISASIVDIAEEREAAMIVMGTGSHELHNRLLGTETALATMRKAHCPVLAVGEKADGLPRVVVVATDFSPGSVHAATCALPLVADGAVVHLVHVWSRIRTPVPLSTLHDVDDAYERSLPERFARMRTALGPSHPLVFRTIVREGPAAQTLLEVARALSADLIVAGTRGFGALERLFVGSVSTDLVRGAHCSTLIVPAPDDEERARLQRHMTGDASI